MLRQLLIKASASDALETQVKNREMARSMAMRFIAGDTVEEGIDAGKELAAAGKRISFDYVGEHADDPEDAREAAKVYHQVLERIDAEGLPAGISVKSTLLARTVEPDLCAELLSEIAAKAGEIGAHVSLDMEDHSLTEDTLQLCSQMHEAGHHHVGVAVQAYLHRTQEDVRRMSDIGASLRLCKGAYDEPEYVAYQDGGEINENFKQATTYLLEHGTYPRIATHDHRLAAHTKAEVGRLGIDHDDFEFQMLYGVRTDMQDALVNDGYRVCIYVPFGENWYAYFMRRLAERPANMLFFARALVGN